MPKTKLIGACAVLLVLILSTALHVEAGRHVKSEACKKCSAHGENTLTAAKVGDRITRSHQLDKTSKVPSVDEFRPTQPGHSPGVGHSINN
ncbi:hypothetical protein CJ030_MR5G003296 [Morella rubra]|uniref:Uncharacterized protein n=1 Tax=Morella rubra TaxID=262757 RepID=A0A6A1VPB9_9ROSI|nr:hypothetical protein CJ030_MR5G003296 [Morella rubra]